MTIKISPNAELRVITSLLMLGVSTNFQVRKTMLRLDSDCFYISNNRELYKIIESLYKAEKPFDDIAVLDILRTRNAEMHDYYTLTIADSMRSTANLEAYVDELVQTKQLREKISITSRMLQQCMGAKSNDEAHEAFNDSMKELTAVVTEKSKSGSTLIDIGVRWFDGHYSGEKIPTNIQQMDEGLDGGIQNSGMITVCGATGSGKTYFALYLLYKIGNNNPDKQSLYFNLEMAEQHNWQRLIGIAAQNPFNKLTNQQRFHAHASLVSHPITIYDESYADIEDIITTARIRAMEKPLSVIAVDYIGMVECKNKYGRDDLKQVSIAKRLASLAIELNCLVIVTCQANRNPESRAKLDRCPYMMDAADSTGSSKSSELWIGIDRPELYNEDEYFKNKFIAKIRKNRNGKQFDMVWNFNIGTFEEYDPVRFFRGLEGVEERSRPFAKV